MSTSRGMGRGLAALIVPDQQPPPTTEPLKRLGEITVRSASDLSKSSYALGHGSLYFLVDEAGTRDAFGNPHAKVMDFADLSPIDLVQTIGELYEKIKRQDEIIEELRQREGLSRSTKLRK